MTDAIGWLKDLKFKQLESDPNGVLLDHVGEFVNNSGLLPIGARLVDVKSDRVDFRDGNGHIVRLEELSDGFRSILSLTFELIRQMAAAFGPDRVFDPNDPTKVICPGVVLIDEVDVHLHPTWQRKIGDWFVDHFPNVQFIVTTHSPIICQAARRGSVFVLARPGSDEQSRMVTGDELNRLIYGNILEAYGTSVFGDGGSLSPASQLLHDELAKLNVKERRSGLDDAERSRQDELRRMFPTTAHSTTVGSNGAAAE